MTSCGVPRIDALLADGVNNAPIGPNDQDAAAVGVVQDFLIGHEFKGLPGPLSGARGVYGPRTTECVRAFQQTCGRPPTGLVDQQTLQALVERPAPAAVASQGYITLVLDIAYQGMTRLMSLTSQFEGAGRFGAFNANTDRAGLSFGLIQWAQKPGRLHEILAAFQQSQPDAYARILGDGDADLARRLLQHTARPHGGVDDHGVTVDAAFDLVAEPWRSRFRAAAQDRALQQVQVFTACADFQSSFEQLRKFAPDLTSERAIAFMLDLANQHGDGGARTIYHTVAGGGGARGGADVLLAIEEESVKRVAAQFGATSAEAASTRSRREAFRTSPLLDDAPFAPGTGVA